MHRQAHYTGTVGFKLKTEYGLHNELGSVYVRSNPMEDTHGQPQ